MLGVCVFEEFAYDVAFIKRFGIAWFVVIFAGIFEYGDETEGLISMCWQGIRFSSRTSQARWTAEVFELGIFNVK